MKDYNLTTFRQSRVLIGLFMTPIVFLGLLSVNLALGTLLFCIFILMYYYFIVGHLTITVDSDNETLIFKWTKKFIFNYRDIEPLKVSDIKSIIVDNGTLLKKIKTLDREVLLNTAKIQQKDAIKFIYRLDVLTKGNGVKKMNSWGEWHEKGYLRLAYKINSVIIILAVIAVAVFIYLKGFNSRLLFLVLFLIPQMLLYGQQMKDTVNTE